MSSVKFKVGFTIQAETLFSIIAKMLPIENLHVEEIIEHQEIKTQSRIAKLVAKMPQVKDSTRRFVHPTGKRVQDFIVEFMEKQSTANWKELSDLIESQGYHKSSINNGLNRLIEAKIIKRTGVGMYKLEKKTT